MKYWIVSAWWGGRIETRRVEAYDIQNAIINSGFSPYEILIAKAEGL